jgi:hypothetical protein
LFLKKIQVEIPRHFNDCLADVFLKILEEAQEIKTRQAAPAL